MNKPVAWGMKDKDGNIYDVICPEEHDRKEGDYTIPLYTYSVKELTDEEIKEVWFKLEHELGSHIMHGFAFARAILRKAQKK